MARKPVIGAICWRKERGYCSREVEVLQLIAEGNTNKETECELQISEKTLERHWQSLMGKLQIHDTAGLTRHAISTGVTP